MCPTILPHLCHSSAHYFLPFSVCFYPFWYQYYYLHSVSVSVSRMIIIFGFRNLAEKHNFSNLSFYWNLHRWKNSEKKSKKPVKLFFSGNLKLNIKIETAFSSAVKNVQYLKFAHKKKFVFLWEICITEKNHNSLQLWTNEEKNTPQWYLRETKITSQWMFSFKV